MWFGHGMCLHLKTIHGTHDRHGAVLGNTCFLLFMVTFMYVRNLCGFALECVYTSNSIVSCGYAIHVTYFVSFTVHVRDFCGLVRKCVY